MPKLPTTSRPPRRSRKPARQTRREAREERKPADAGISKWKLAVGAAGLFLFIIGLKRSWPTDLEARTEAGASDGKARPAGTLEEGGNAGDGTP